MKADLLSGNAMFFRRRAIAPRFLALSMLAAAAGPGWAQPQASGPAENVTSLFAVEIQVGPKWDASKPTQDQAHFREHSAHLKRLRDAGSLVLGGRYADKGLVVLAAGTESQARALMDADPSMQAQTFRYELHPFRVFYGGAVAPPPRPAPTN